MADEALLATAEAPAEDGADTAEAPQELGKWNEQLDEKLQTALKKIADHISDEFKYPRRLEVMKDWQARSFWREMQHLNWNWEGECWDVLGPAGAKSSTDAAKYDSAVLYATNIFQGFGDSFIAVITQAVPSLTFEPDDPEEAADIETARQGDTFRKFIQRANDPFGLLTKMSYYGWCGGRLHGWTRWEIDKRTDAPRETQSIYGSMEVKVSPMIAEQQSEYLGIQFSMEYPLATRRAIVRARAFDDTKDEYWKKIKGGSTGNGQDVYERTARISVKQGISMRSAGGDAYAHLVTTQRTWVRPEAFMLDCVPEDERGKLESLFPNGCYMEFDNGVYTGSRDENMDDCWAVENIMEGDGSFRNGKGTCLVGVQERFNDIINLTQDVYEKTVPASHWDDKIFDLDAMKRQYSMPGAKYGVNFEELPAGDALANHSYYEPAASVSPDMLQYAKELMSDVPQFLTGISAILFGADQSGDKSGKALSIQQSAAMGRIGLPFRTMKRLYARMMEQAIRCAARNRTEDMRMGIPDQSGNIETIAVRIEDLKGNARCYTDSDEAYPVSWHEKGARYQALMQEGNADPQLRATLALPENQEMGKKLIGLPDLKVAGADSWNKQMREINIMLQQPPTAPSATQVPNPLQPETLETVPVPPQASLPVDKDYDNHQAEFDTVASWINSPAGQKAAKENPAGFSNVRLHGLEHKALIPPPPMPMPMPAPNHAKIGQKAPAPAGAAA